MIKGCKKKIIYLKNTDSDIFDEAYFVLRRDTDSEYYEDTDMVEEARRIIEGVSGVRRNEKKRRGAWFFSLGALCASAVLALAGILLALI